MVQFPSFLSWEHWHLTRANDLPEVPTSSIQDWADTGSTCIFLPEWGALIGTRAGYSWCIDGKDLCSLWILLMVLDLPPRSENKWAASEQKKQLSWCSGTLPGSKELCSFLPSHPGERWLIQKQPLLGVGDTNPESLTQHRPCFWSRILHSLHLVESSY